MQKGFIDNSMTVLASCGYNTKKIDPSALYIIKCDLMSLTLYAKKTNFLSSLAYYTKTRSI